MYWEINIQSINKYLLEIMYTFIFLYNEFISVGVGPPYIYIKADIQMQQIYNHMSCLHNLLILFWHFWASIQST